MRIRLPFLILSLLSVPSAAASQLEPSALLGCYDVGIGEWVPVRDWGMDSLYLAPPSRIELDTVSAEGSRGLMSVRVPSGALPSIHRISGWEVLGDSVRFRWTNGFSGFNVIARPTSDGLIGEAHSFWDFNRERQTAPFSLRRVACDSSPPVTEQDQRQLLTSVSFTDGTRVALGEPVQPGIGWEEKTYERYSTLVRTNPTIDFLGPVESVEVWTQQDGSVSRIDVHFLSAEEFDAAVQKVIDELGEPTYRSDTTRDGVRTQGMAWMNRTDRVSLRGTQGDEGLWEIILYLDVPRRS